MLQGSQHNTKKDRTKKKQRTKHEETKPPPPCKDAKIFMQRLRKMQPIRAQQIIHKRTRPESKDVDIKQKPAKRITAAHEPPLPYKDVEMQPTMLQLASAGTRKPCRKPCTSKQHARQSNKTRNSIGAVASKKKTETSPLNADEIIATSTKCITIAIRK
jgi:hypothetical protein